MKTAYTFKYRNGALFVSKEGKTIAFGSIRTGEPFRWYVYRGNKAIAFPPKEIKRMTRRYVEHGLTIPEWLVRARDFDGFTAYVNHTIFYYKNGDYVDEQYIG